jgi:hypothetical protein
MNLHSIKLQVNKETPALIKLPKVETKLKLSHAKPSISKAPISPPVKIHAKMNRDASTYFLIQLLLSECQITVLTLIVILKTLPRLLLALSPIKR